jgi:hypothetical protein
MMMMLAAGLWFGCLMLAPAGLDFFRVVVDFDGADVGSSQSVLHRLINRSIHTRTKILFSFLAHILARSSSWSASAARPPPFAE